MPAKQYDCGFDIENYHYRFRAGGLLVKDGKILFVETKFGDYCYVVSGGIKLGESSEAAILKFYNSEISETLSRESSKLWQEGWVYIYQNL